MYLRPALSFCFVSMMMLYSLGCAQEPASTNSTTTVGTPSTVQEKTQTQTQDLNNQNTQGKEAGQQAAAKEKMMEVATFGGGCFWCTEAVFLELKGVASVKPGYMGGNTKNPTYKDICTGTTNHAEVIQITFDPSVVSFDTLIQVFWKTHDPTTLNRQGADVGTQYRSVVFYHNETQNQKASDYKKKLNDAKAYPNPVVTEISPASTFYIAEDYHQNFFAKNPNQGYCRRLIPPKLEKLKQVFGDKLKN